MSEERLQRIEDLLTQLIAKVSDISSVQKDMQKEQKEMKTEFEKINNRLDSLDYKIDDVAQSVKYLVHKMAEHDEMIFKIRDRINV